MEVLTKLGQSAASSGIRSAGLNGMICKTDKIRAAWAVGDRIGALRIAARFFDRSGDTNARSSAAWTPTTILDSTVSLARNRSK